MTHKHEWLPTADQPGVEATTYFGWCECEETLDLTELCKRANATEELSAEMAREAQERYQDMWSDELNNGLRKYAEKRGEG